MADDHDPLVDAGSVLVLDDTGEGEDGYYCHASLDAGAAANRAELRVTFPDHGTERVGFANGDSGRQAARRAVVAVGDVVQAGGASADDLDSPLYFDAVTDPGDVRRLGTTISRICGAWGEEHDVVACFDSLSDLLEHRDAEDVFRFVHVLIERFATVDAVAHFHLDPASHDERVVRTFEDLFDGVITEFEADERALEFVGGGSRASDADVAAVADVTATVADAALEEAEPAGDPSGNRFRGDGPAAQASDDDIAEALED